MRQAAGDHGFGELVPRRDAQAPVVVERAFAALGDEQVFVRRIVDQAGDDGAVRVRARSRPQNAGCCAGNWWCRRADRRSSGGTCRRLHARRLPRRGSRSRPRLGEVVAQDLLGAAVGGGDEIARPLQRNLQMLDLAEIALEAAAGAPGGFDHDVEDGGVQHGVRVRGAARAVKPAAGDTGGEGRNSAQNSHSPLQSPATVIEIAGSSPAMTSVIVLAMRSAPELLSRDENFSALCTDLRQRMPAVGAGSLTICASSHDVRRRKRKRNAERRGSVPTASFGAARALQSALAIRRSTTALCQWDYSSQGSTWARLRDTPAHAAGSPPAGVALPAMHLARRS